MAASLDYEKMLKQLEEMSKRAGPAPPLGGAPDWRSIWEDGHISDAIKYGQAITRTIMPADKFTTTNMRSMLSIRMGWNIAGETCPFKHCEPHKLNDSEAVVFVIHNGNPLMLRDDLNLFPSDALITQIRLLADK